jgi:hypothetical protein
VRSKRAPTPPTIPDTLSEAQRAIVEGAKDDATRIVLISLFERAAHSSQSSSRPLLNS